MKSPIQGGGIYSLFGGSNDPQSPYALDLLEEKKKLTPTQRLFGSLGSGPGNMRGGSNMKLQNDMASRLYAKGGAVDDALGVARKHFSLGGPDQPAPAPAPAPAPVPPPSNVDRITSAYQTYAGRAPDQAAIDNYSGMLNGGGNFSQVVNGIVNSQEGRNYLSQIDSNGIAPNEGVNYDNNFVNSAYSNYFGRDAADPEKAYWTGQLNNGNISGLGFINRLRGDAGMNPYIASQGIGFGSNEDLIKQNYKDIFGRDANADELGYWGGELGSGRQNSSQFIDRLTSDRGATLHNNPGYIRDSYLSNMGRAANEDEVNVWRNALANGATRDHMNDVIANAGIVRDYYNHYHGRDPSVDEGNYWMGELGKGLGVSDFRNALMNDPAHNAAQNRDFILDEYNGLLGRAPNESEMNYWLDQLTNKGSNFAMVDKAISEDPASQAWQASNFQPYDVASNGATPGPNQPRTKFQHQMAAIPKFNDDTEALGKAIWSEGEILRNRENGSQELDKIGWSIKNRALSGFDQMPSWYKKSHNLNSIRDQITNPGYDGNGAYSYFNKERAKMAEEAFAKDPKLRQYYYDKARGIIENRVEDPTGGSVAYFAPRSMRPGKQFFAETTRGKKEGWYRTDGSGAHKYFGQNKFTPLALAAQKAQLDAMGAGGRQAGGGGPPAPPPGSDLGRNIPNEVSTGNFYVDQGVGVPGVGNGGGQGGGGAGTSPHPAPHPAPHPHPPSHGNNHGITVGPLIDNATGTHYGNNWDSGGNHSGVHHHASGHGAVDPYFGHNSGSYNASWAEQDRNRGMYGSDAELDAMKKRGGRVDDKDDHLDYIKKRLNFREGGNVPSQLLQVKSNNIGRSGYATDGAVDGEVSYAPDDLPMMAESPEAVKRALSVAGRHSSPHEFVQSRLFDPNDEKQLPQSDPEAGVRTAKQAALTAYGFTDAGGVQQALGYMPKAEGGFEPSVAEDLRSGNYLAGTLGAIGAVVPGAGRLAKAARGADAVSDATKVAQEVAAPTEKAAETFTAAKPTIIRPENIDTPTIRHVLEGNGYDDLPEGLSFTNILNRPANFASQGVLRNDFNDAVRYHLSLGRKDRRQNSREALEALEPYLGSHADGTFINLLTENAKNKKAREIGLMHEGAPVETTGMALEPAMQWGNINLCGNHASCQQTCNGKKSGMFYQLGGGKDIRGLEAASGSINHPRANQLARTIAMMQERKAFATRLADELTNHIGDADARGAQLASRLNTYSDLHPSVWAPFVGAFDDSNFYDYTKHLGTKISGPNHHLTRSSTGISTPEVLNEHSNWRKVRESLDRGENVAMAFSHKTLVPEEIFDDETRTLYEAANGTIHDFMPAHKVKPGERGKIIALKNMDAGTTEALAPMMSKGFLVPYDPQILREGGKKSGNQLKDADGKPLAGNKRVTIPDQREYEARVKERKGRAPGGRASLPPQYFHQQFHNAHDYLKEGRKIPEWWEVPINKSARKR